MVSIASRGFGDLRLHLVPSLTTASSCSEPRLSANAAAMAYGTQETSFGPPRVQQEPQSSTLNRAFSRVALNDSSVSGGEVASQSQPYACMEQEQSQSQALSVPRRSGSGKRGALALDMSGLASQDCFTQGTQGFSTPVDQQFLLLDPGAAALMDEDSRSPAPSPKKRHRRVDTQDSDSMSQDGLSMSQSRSQGEPSSASKGGGGGAGGPQTRPPTGPKAKKRNEPTRFAQQTPQPATASVSRLNREYAVENKELGHGNFSTVYRAVHRQCGKAYAIKKSKRPLHSATDLAQWMSEVRSLAAVEGHHNIVTYHDSWSEPSIGGEYQYIKLELCGDSLATHVKAKQALGNVELWEITRQVASALQHVHSLGLVHLDIKPDNIMRAAPPQHMASGSAGGSSSSGSSGSAGGTYKLGDFGHATVADGSRGWTEGDARYMAAEMLKTGSSGPVPSLEKFDMFALGATLYELASGIPLPPSGERWSALREGRHAMLLPAVQTQLQTLMKRLMSPDPSVRPDATSVLATCEKQKQMGTLPLQPSLPKPSRQSL